MKNARKRQALIAEWKCILPTLDVFLLEVTQWIVRMAANDAQSFADRIFCGFLTSRRLVWAIISTAPTVGDPGSWMARAVKELSVYNSGLIVVWKNQFQVRLSEYFSSRNFGLKGCMSLDQCLSHCPADVSTADVVEMVLYSLFYWPARDASLKSNRPVHAFLLFLESRSDGANVLIEQCSARKLSIVKLLILALECVEHHPSKDIIRRMSALLWSSELKSFMVNAAVEYVEYSSTCFSTTLSTLLRGISKAADGILLADDDIARILKTIHRNNAIGTVKKTFLYNTAYDVLNISPTNPSFIDVTKWCMRFNVFD